MASKTNKQTNKSTPETTPDQAQWYKWKQTN